MEDWKKAIINAGIMGGITFFSVVLSDGGCVTIQSAQTAIIAFGLTFLTLLSKYFRPPETDNTESKPKEKEPSISQIIGCLWI